MIPKIAMCNIFDDVVKLKEFAREHDFSGIDYSFEMENLPENPREESSWVKEVMALGPIEVRYHCPFNKIDLGHIDPEKAKSAEIIFQRIIRLVSKAGGRHLSIHIGLGRNSTEPLSWDETIGNLRRLVQYGAEHGVRVSLENLAWGWTSKPNLFEKLVRMSSAAVTFDIGHAEICESVQTQQYNIEDFITPHPDRVINAHIYHKEISGLGHMPPDNLADIEERLSILKEIGCEWWVIEVKEEAGLLKTKEIVEEFISHQEKRII